MKPFLLLALFLHAAGAQTIPHVDASKTRVKAARRVHTTLAGPDAVYAASGNISDDLAGELDTRPDTWGFADSFSTPIIFDPPAGYHIFVIRIEGDLSGMPKHLAAAPVEPNTFAGLLEGFSTNTTNAAGCNLCATNTPQYRQIFTADGAPFHSPFTYDYGAGIQLGADNTLNAIGAVYLNTIGLPKGLPIHAELTYTIWYRFEPQ